MKLTDAQLDEAWNALNAGVPIFEFLAKKDWEIKPVEVRRAMVEKYGNEDFRRVFRGKVMKNLMTPEKTIERIIFKANRQCKTKEEFDSVIAILQDGIVRLTAKRNTLGG